MDNAKLWDDLIAVPRLINTYAGYSVPLLGVLFAGGVLLLAIHFWKKRTGPEGLATPWVYLGVALLFFSLAGSVLKGVGAYQERAQRKAFVDRNRVPPGEHWLLVFDFTLPPAVKPETHDILLGRMDMLVKSMSELLHENLPQEFQPPRVVRITTAESPWQGGISEQNFDEVSRDLNAFELVWGNVYEEGRSAKAFLGLDSRLSKDFDRVIPLREMPLDEDPRRELQFGDAYYRLLGLVTLGMALDTYHEAERATGPERNALFVKLVRQIRTAQAAVINQQDDPMLKRTLYGPKVQEIVDLAVREGGVSP